MANFLRSQNGMRIVGQGGRILLFALPSLIAAMQVHVSYPRVAALPEGLGFLRPAGCLLLIVGMILWGVARVQVRRGFSSGRLVTTGAYGVVRHPIYSSLTLFVLPGISLITLTWVYLIVSIFLYLGVMLFIGAEERQLLSVFGREYEEYLARVDRMVPFKRP